MTAFSHNIKKTYLMNSGMSTASINDYLQNYEGTERENKMTELVNDVKVYDFQLSVFLVGKILMAKGVENVWKLFSPFVFKNSNDIIQFPKETNLTEEEIIEITNYIESKKLAKKAKIPSFSSISLLFLKNLGMQILNTENILKKFKSTLIPNEPELDVGQTPPREPNNDWDNEFLEVFQPVENPEIENNDKKREFESDESEEENEGEDENKLLDSFKIPVPHKHVKLDETDDENSIDYDLQQLINEVNEQ